MAELSITIIVTRDGWAHIGGRRYRWLRWPQPRLSRMRTAYGRRRGMRRWSRG